MSDDNLYYSKSKNKYIKIAEMPDQHVRRAFIKMNKENGSDYITKNYLDVKLEQARSILTQVIWEIKKSRDKDEPTD